MWLQRNLTLPGMPRGCHLMTNEVLGGLPELAGEALRWGAPAVCGEYPTGAP